ncbi:hypothetical protein BaRGS_00034495 [Batillaria attramentaria]|uniref:Uncharacterized protein n=1 Tax=Batillaria attramentaria TaxID=370345 RepID=A0ABD0JH77_9CAEN
MKRTAAGNDAAECGSPAKRSRDENEESCPNEQVREGIHSVDCPPVQTAVDRQVEEEDDTSPSECPDIVSDVDLDLDILDRDLFLSDTSSEGDTLELETLYNDLTVSDTSSEEDEDERPGTVEQSSDDSSEDDSSDDSSSEDESSDDESLEERVRCTFCGLVMTRRLFNEHTSTSRADYVTSPAIARVPRCKLCGSRTPPSPLARPHDSKQGDYVEEMPLGPHFTKDAESGNLRKFVILKCRDLRLQHE